MLTNKEIKEKVIQAIKKEKSLKKVLIIPPDFTRFFSNAGLITNILYHYFEDNGIETVILPALGTHVPMTREQIKEMYLDIPFEKFKTHNWRKDVVKLGVVPKNFVSEVTEGLWNESIDVEVNKLFIDPTFDLIISVGQVVPHEVIGMANHSKNIFVGIGGSQMINESHIVGAVYGMERMMGRDNTPVRKIFDWAMEHYLKPYNLEFMLTVCTAPGGNIQTHGLFIGKGRKCLEDAIKLSQEKNIDFLDTGIKKCVVYLDPKEFKSTWLGNKAVYRTRMAIADGGQLIILAPGVERFGEDPGIDILIRKYGYCGRLKTLELLKKEKDLKENMSVAAHLIHGSSDGRFSITYAVDKLSQEEIENVHFKSASYKEMAKLYNPKKLKYGYNTLENGEKIYYIPNPALGLWINKEKFTK